MNESGYSESSGLFALLGSGVGLFIFIVFGIFPIICLWKVFTKANKSGWAVLIPVYNLIVLLQIVKRPLWWIILMCIPCVNIVVLIMVYIDLAKAFGKDTAFGIGIILLPFIFIPILAFGSAQYQGNQTPSVP